MATYAEGSREYYSQFISNIANIQFGELPLRPDVGVPDMTFQVTGTLSPIVSAISKHIPEIAVISVSQEELTTAGTLGTEVIAVQFEVL
jgi:hypothetical protein